MTKKGAPARELQRDAAQRRRRALSIRLLRLLVGIAILVALFQLVPGRRVWEELKQSDLKWLLAGFLASLALQWPVAIRLRLLASVHDLQLSKLEIVRINLAARFYGLALPGGTVTTMAVRSFRLGNPRSGYVSAATVVALDRILATLTMCMMGVILWIADWPQHSIAWLVVMAGSFSLLCGVIIAASRLLSTDASSSDHARLPWISGRLSRIRQAVAQAKTMRGRDLLAAIGLSILAHLFGIAAHVCVAVSMDLGLKAVTIGWIRSAMLLASMIPMSIAGLGLREGTSLLTLPAYDVAAESAVAYSLLITLVSVIGVGLLGGLLEMYRFLAGALHRHS